MDEVLTEWRDIPGLPYQVSEFGQVRRSVAGRGTRVGQIRKDQPHKYGYRQIVLSQNDHQTNCLVHILVAAAFIGPCPQGMEVNHKNGVKDDNRSSNLEYVTSLGNVAHAIIAGLHDNRGERNGRSRLEAVQVANIRSEYARGGIGYERIAERYSVGVATIQSIVRRKSWTHLLTVPMKSA